VPEYVTIKLGVAVGIAIVVLIGVIWALVVATQ
jgi:hypothetical protein